jgi:hypothetical protein
MPRALLLTTTVLVTLFLVFLGMRNPQLSKYQGPKQRPRAIVVYGQKVPQQIETQLPEQAFAAICPDIPLLEAPHCMVALDFFHVAILPVTGFFPTPPSRASPRFTPPLT